MQKADKAFSDFILKYCENPTFLAFNKIDKLKKQKEKAALNKVKKEVCPMHFTISSEYEFTRTR